MFGGRLYPQRTNFEGVCMKNLNNYPHIVGSWLKFCRTTPCDMETCFWKNKRIPSPGCYGNQKSKFTMAKITWISGVSMAIVTRATLERRVSHRERSRKRGKFDKLSVFFTLNDRRWPQMTFCHTWNLNLNIFHFLTLNNLRRTQMTPDNILPHLKFDSEHLSFFYLKWP